VVARSFIHLDNDPVLDPGLAKTPLALKHAMVLSTERLGFYSAWRRTKFAFKRTGGEAFAFMGFVSDPKGETGQQFAFSD